MCIIQGDQRKLNTPIFRFYNENLENQLFGTGKITKHNRVFKIGIDFPFIIRVRMLIDIFHCVIIAWSTTIFDINDQYSYLKKYKKGLGKLISIMRFYV